MTKITEEIKDLFNQVRVLCGAKERSVELPDDVLCTLLEVCISDYAQKVQSEIIANNFVNIYGKKMSNIAELAYAFSTRGLDLSKQYSYWFSKQVGLQQEGPYELKKDFITIEKENRYISYRQVEP